MSGCHEPVPAGAPLYRRLLGNTWDALPDTLRAMHNVTTQLTATGEATVERGNGLLARGIGRLFGFPPAGEKVPVAVVFTVHDRREFWKRTFGGRSFASTQEEGRGRFEGLLCERFGPLAFGLALVFDSGRLRLIVRRWSAFGIPMPSLLAPTGDAYEHEDGGRFRFHVEIVVPLAGLVVAYRGWLAPSESAGSHHESESNGFARQIGECCAATIQKCRSIRLDMPSCKL